MATPGSACTLTLVGENSEEQIPGTVSADGKLCVPGRQFSGTLAAINVGVACGTKLSLAGLEIVCECRN
jgi:hypothetical protein